MEEVARFVLALEQPEVAEEVMHFLDRTGHARVVGSASDERQLLEAIRQLEPDAVVAAPTFIPSGERTLSRIAKYARYVRLETSRSIR